MGFLKKARQSVSHMVGEVTGSNARRQAQGDIAAGMARAEGETRPAYATAAKQLGDTRTAAMDQIRSGYGNSRNDIASGFNAAQARYNSPEIVKSREELYQRVLGNGGYKPEQLEAMKAGAREEFGTAMREGIRNINPYMGDSGAGGAAGEGLGDFVAQIGGKRANAVRDIDINNAQLARREMTDAIGSLYNEAGDRAKLDVDQGTALGGLSKAEADTLAQIESQTGLNLANLTTEEAQMLASMFTTGGSAIAGMRNIAGLMPLLGGASQGAGAALGAKLAAPAAAAAPAALAAI